MAGAAVGATLGLIGGPAAAVGGAAGGALLAKVLRRVGADLRQRVLGPREELRIGAATAHAGAMIQTLLDAGKQPRDDGFFDASSGDAQRQRNCWRGYSCKRGMPTKRRRCGYSESCTRSWRFIPGSARRPRIIFSLLLSALLIASSSHGHRARRGESRASPRRGLPWRCRCLGGPWRGGRCAAHRDLRHLSTRAPCRMPMARLGSVSPMSTLALCDYKDPQARWLV